MIFFRYSWDIGSLVFILTFEFLSAGLNFDTSDLITFWLSGGQLLRPSGLVKVQRTSPSSKSSFWAFEDARGS